MKKALSSATSTAATNSSGTEGEVSAIRPAAASITRQRSRSATTITRRGPRRPASSPPPSSATSRGSEASASSEPSTAGLTLRASVQVSAMYQEASPRAARPIEPVNPR